MISRADSGALPRRREWARRKGELPRFIRYYQELFQIQEKAEPRINTEKAAFKKDSIHDRLTRGMPLLPFEDFSPDWRQVQRVFGQVLAWAGKGGQAPPDGGKSLRKVGRDISLLKKLCQEWYLGHSLKDISIIEGFDHELIGQIVAATLKAFLSAYARLLLPQVDHTLWRRRFCPVCGGGADFAYLEKDKGTRWLLCSRCDADWLFLRLECPHCGTQKQDDLAYFTDGRESRLYRLYVCEQCQMYIKAIDLRHTEVEVLLPLERVMTLDMDEQAQQAGYEPYENRTFWLERVLNTG